MIFGGFKPFLGLTGAVNFADWAGAPSDVDSNVTSEFVATAYERDEPRMKRTAR